VKSGETREFEIPKASVSRPAQKHSQDVLPKKSEALGQQVVREVGDGGGGRLFGLGTFRRHPSG
jgi:hypothetical protein